MGRRKSEVFIHASGEYVPQKIVDNEYFSRLTGRPTQWFEQLTGLSRRRSSQEEINSFPSVSEAADPAETIR